MASAMALYFPFVDWKPYSPKGTPNLGQGGGDLAQRRRPANDRRAEHQQNQERCHATPRTQASETERQRTEVGQRRGSRAKADDGAESQNE